MKSVDQELIMKDEGKWESFGFNASISWKGIILLALVSMGKHLKLDNQLIRFDILIEILSAILLSLTPKFHLIELLHCVRWHHRLFSYTS